MTTLTLGTIKDVVRKLLLPGEDYRTVIVEIINAQFLDFTIGFFRDIAMAKLANKKIEIDWYKEKFIEDNLSKDEIAHNAGINIKTISNIHGTARKEVVIDAAKKNYNSIKKLIETLIAESDDIGVNITIKFNKVSVDLDISESLIVINALAVKRAAMRGGLWSSVGKKTEVPIMIALCHLHSVARKNYALGDIPKDDKGFNEREIDFYLMPDGALNKDQRIKCEVKLMGKGNPESADAVIARASKVFIADTLSESNIRQLNGRDVEWIHLKTKNGYRRFGTVLKNLGIPYKPYNGDLEKDIDEIIKKTFS